ncbi:MAG: multi-sensor hybrid histidine kinase [Bryobacterales bacterium]|nr:multi-sensor hybrid histidine kinase [Bryobacterales bacterium]
MPEYSRFADKQHLVEQIAALVPVVINVFDLVAERDVYISSDVVNLLGYTGHEIAQMGDRFSTLWHPDDISRYRDNLARLRALADDEIFEMEYRVRHRDGRWLWLESRSKPFSRNEQGDVCQVVTATVDITARKQAEEALRASEERFRGYLELGLIGVAITSPQKCCIEVNDELCRMLGYERSELLGMTWAELTHPDDLAANLANFERVVAGQCDAYSMDKRFVCKDGQVLYATVSVKGVRREDGTVESFVALLQDITARKETQEGLERARAELESRVAERTREVTAANVELRQEIAERQRAQEELRRSEANLADAQRISHVGSWAWNVASGKIFWSLENFRIFGLDPEGFHPTMDTISMFVHPEDNALVGHVFEKAMSEKTSFEAEHRILLQDGSIRYLHTIGHPVVSDSGELIEFVGATMDVTDRKRAEIESGALKDALAAELAAMTRLHEFSTRLLSSTDLKPLLEEVLNATMALQGADMGTVQLYNPAIGALEIVAQHGFQQVFLDHFATVHDTSPACGRALHQRARVVIEDVQIDAGFAPHRHIATSAGYRAVQSTPLFSRGGDPVGMISTYFRQPHRPSERDLRLTDLYALHAAELIERKQSEAAVLRYQQELQALTATLIEVQERESKYLARELHDGFSQKLAVLAMDMAALAHRTEESSQELGGRLLDFTSQIGTLAKDIHRISHHLHPAILDDLGLAAALRNQCAAFSEQYGIPTEFAPNNIPRTVPDDISLCLYRIAQECLRNINKHAEATEVRVALNRSHDEIAMEIADAGEGFDLDSIQGKGGLGLISMEERVRLVNGTFSIRSQPGKGTLVRVCVPLHLEES